MNPFSSPEFQSNLIVMPDKPKPVSLARGVLTVLSFWIAAWILVVAASVILGTLLFA